MPATEDQVLAAATALRDRKTELDILLSQRDALNNQRLDLVAKLTILSDQISTKRTEVVSARQALKDVIILP